MENQLFTLENDSLEAINLEQQTSALTALESGQVVYFPNYFFVSSKKTMQDLLTDAILDGKHKNVSYDYRTGKSGGFKQDNNGQLPALLKTFMHDYALFARKLIDTICPEYGSDLIWGRTSYRPAEIKGRVSSKRKDDTRVHVDSFPATPVNGNRILRIFCNINPDNVARVWELGEPFAQVLERFAPRIPAYSPLRAKCLQIIKATKTLRSAYDHYQLHMHDMMKLDDDYQQSVAKQRIDFPANSTWIVFTDQVSHAALSGQYLLEQTFYLPAAAMVNPDLSPLAHWQKAKSFTFSR
ncbi:Kdo hydroxylase family protein [Legionella dresdenensis]|uniref:Kdo hydroxylase family protein n=1 Tax=Legionella dresdenensis TaxID=450200 RepID=A0ABV8CI09_9GAMM